jgi:hypothetical protein
LASWVIYQAFSFAIFLAHMTVFSSIESKETGKMPA